jgi:chitodextrinase
MGYLIYADYKRLIQSDNLNQIIGSDPSIITQAEGTALEEATSRLQQKFLLSQEFQDTPAWNKAAMYVANNRVYVDGPAFSQTATYAAGDIVSNQISTNTINVYQSIAGSAPGAFNPTDWLLLGTQQQIYFARVPAPTFDLYAQYAKGDVVYYNGRTYTCLIQTSPYSQETELQFRLNENVPYNNIFPDNVNSGAQYWAAGSVYAIPAGTEITNTSYWVKGDNRSQLIVTTQIACVLYWVHYRIAPRNVPDMRVKAYDDAIKWYVNCANGDVTPNLPVKQPRQGGRIRFGGTIKNINSY